MRSNGADGTKAAASFAYTRSKKGCIDPDFTGALGLPIPDELFVFVAGALCLLFGIFPRETTLMTLVRVDLTPTVFPWTGLIGYLRIYGILAVLL